MWFYKKKKVGIKEILDVGGEISVEIDENGENISKIVEEAVENKEISNDAKEITVENEVEN